jgi:pyridoxal biosynthesis lyase PdxS
MSRFVFMLTRDDATVADAVEICREIAALDIDIVGFKDVGLPLPALAEVVDVLRDQGREIALEVVSETRDEELRAVDAGLRLGVDLLLGGVNVAAALRHIAGHDGNGVRYCPFPGEVVGHPSALRGTIGSIVDSAQEIAAADGVWGLDLLAYRFDGDADALVRKVIDAVEVPVIVAGSVADPARIASIVAAGAWGFTVGSAAFEGRFVPGAPLIAQLRAVIEATHQATEKGR